MTRLTDIIAAMAIVGCAAMSAQESKGTADLAVQGFYSPGGTDTYKSTTGVAANFRYILSGGMLLEGRAENYSASGFRLTENYLTLRGVAAGAWRLEFTGGDLSIPGRQLEFFTPQLYSPLYRMRGARVQGLRGRLGWSGYGGAVTYLEGPRLPFSVLGPQTRSGGGVTWKQSETLEFAGQFDTISTAPDDGASSRPYLLQSGRRYGRSSQSTAMVSWKPTKQFKLFGEAAHTTGTPLDSSTVKPSPMNAMAAAEYENGRWAGRASYARQSAGYTPVAGYYTGDRGSGFVEGRVRPWRRIDLFASAGNQRNNFERNPAVWTFHSSSANAGVSAELPGGVNVTTQMSKMSLDSESPEGEKTRSHNRQLMLMGAKSYGNQTTRFSWRKFDMEYDGARSSQGAFEGEQTLRLGRWSTSGAVRWNNSRSTESRDSVFVRAMVQGTLRRATFHAFTEMGRDLANQTLFAMNQVQTTVAGFSMPVARGWTVQGEVLKSSIAMALNPQSAFVLAANGAPVSMSLGGMDRLNIFFRVSRHLNWGGAAPSSSYATTLAGVAPVVGSIEGFVKDEEGIAAAGIPVVLDGYRTVHTDDHGRYKVLDVMQGQHKVELSPRELPAEYDPASGGPSLINVRSARTERRDFNLVRLMSLTGQVLAPPNSKVEEIVIRLDGTRRLTTPDEDGRFAFYNLPAGDYKVVLDESTLAEERRLSGPGSASVSLRRGGEPVEVIFGIEAVVIVKPVRQINLRASSSSSNATQAPAPAPPSGSR